MKIIPVLARLVLCLATGLSVSISADWPQWRGPNRDGIAPGPALTLKSLPTDLKPVWKIKIGGGFSSPVIVGDSLVYFDEDGSEEVVHRIDARTGKEAWRTPIAPRFQDEWGAGPRSTPIIDEGHVFAQACNGEFRCLRLADGSVVWGTSFEKDFGVKFLGSKANEGTASRRGNNGTGVVDGKRLILTVGGTNDCTLVCFDKSSGKVLWRTGTDEAAYSSLMVATLAGVRQVVAFAADGLMAADLETGRLLWRVPLRTNAKRHAATPVIRGDHVIVTSHSIGLLCFKIVKQGDRVEAVPAWANRDLKINLSTPALVGGHLYGQGARQDYVCADAETGALKWSQKGFGDGRRDNTSTIVVGDRLVVLTDAGELVLLAASPEKYVELGRLQVCGTTWVHPAYAEGRVFLRDGTSLTCVDLRSAN